MATTTFDKPVGSNQILTSDVIDNLTTNDASKVLSAKQGKIINDHITSYHIVTDVSLSAVESALSAFGATMADGDVRSIDFSVAPAEGVFAQTRTFGTIRRVSSGRYNVLVQQAVNFGKIITGSSFNNVWSWNSVYDQIGTLNSKFTSHEDIRSSITWGSAVVSRSAIKNGNIVEINFRTTQGGAAVNTVLFTLPSDYIPYVLKNNKIANDDTMYFTVASYDNSVYGSQIGVKTNGNVIAIGRALPAYTGGSLIFLV